MHPRRLTVDLFEAIEATTAVRHLDATRAVETAHVRTLIESATRAASAANRQPARWLVVADGDVKRRLAGLYRDAARERLEAHGNRAADLRAQRLNQQAWYLAEHLGEAPVLILPCAEGRRGEIESSVYPGVQNLMLAARALGLGTTLTTTHLRREAEVKELLGIPEAVRTICLIPVGYPADGWRPMRRRPAREVTFWNRWNSPPPDM
jgi:nitroreductase